MALALAVRLLASQEPGRETPRGVVYYSGPMKAKFRDSWGSEDGKSYTREQSEQMGKQAQENMGR